MTRRLALFVAAFVAVGVCVCRVADAMGGRMPTRSGYFVRVAIVPEAASVTLNVTGDYRLRGNTLRVIHEGRGLHGVQVAPQPGGLRVGGFLVPAGRFHVEAERDGVITVNGQRVRGKVEILRLDDARVQVINRIDLEDYLAAVLVREVPRDWPIEALKAQAIASRTYAVYQTAQRARLDFDLTGDVNSQVYGGKNAEHRRTNLAVDLTRGQILTYQGQIVPAFFSACCGGHTEAARELWEIDIPPLRGRACPFDRDTPHAAWRRAVPLATVAASLRAAGTDVGALERVGGASWTISGRLKTVRLYGARGEAVITAKAFRAALGADLLKSTLVTLTVDGPQLVISGRGWGHGVGLCQWGALGMARSGYTAKDIVEYYYPSASISQLPPVEPVAVPVTTTQP